MGVKISVNLEESSLKFLDRATSNRSAYINGLIREKEKEAFECKLEADYREQSNDLEWQAEGRALGRCCWRWIGKVG